MYYFSILGGEGRTDIHGFDASSDTIHLTDGVHDDGETLNVHRAPVQISVDADDLLLTIGDNLDTATHVCLRGLGTYFADARTLSDLIHQGLRIELFN